MQTGNPRRRIWITIGLIAVIILALVYFVDWEETLLLFSEMDWVVLLFGIIFLVIGVVLISVRWRYVLGNVPGLKETFHSDSIGYLVTMLTPVPGPALRVVALTKSTNVPVSSATPAMIIDLLFTTVMRILALILAITLKLSLERSLTTIFIGSILIIAVLGFIFWLVRSPDKVIPWIAGLIGRIPFMKGERLEKFLSDLQAGLSSLSSTKSVFYTLFLSIVMWVCFWIFHYLGFVAMPVALETREMLSLAAAALVVLPPSAPGMIGVFQGVMVGFLILFRITNSSTLTAFAILVFSVQLILWVILGAWALLSTRMKLGDLIRQSGDALREGDNFEEQTSGLIE